MIRSDEIEMCSNYEDPLMACKATDRANAAGGHDNITVIVAPSMASATVTHRFVRP